LPAVIPQSFVGSDMLKLMKKKDKNNYNQHSKYKGRLNVRLAMGTFFAFSGPARRRVGVHLKKDAGLGRGGRGESEIAQPCNLSLC